jgi:4a-hydroxytetrahydrobiopterin dehydratase
MLAKSSRYFASLLSQSQLTEILSSHPNWSITESKTHIEANYEFKNFAEAWEFMGKVAVYAEQEDHHPEWFNVYNRVKVQLSTHDAGGVTEKDTNMAHFMDVSAV